MGRCSYYAFALPVIGMPGHWVVGTGDLYSLLLSPLTGLSMHSSSAYDGENVIASDSIKTNCSGLCESFSLKERCRVDTFSMGASETCSARTDQVRTRLDTHLLGHDSNL